MADLMTVDENRRFESTSPDSALPQSSRVEPRRLVEVQRSLLTRGIVYAVLSFLTAFFVLVWALLCIVGLRNAVHDPPTFAAGVLVLLLGIGLPGVVGVVLFWRARVNFRERSRVSELVAALTSGGVRSFDDLARAMQLPRLQAERALTDAIGRGLFAPSALSALAAPVKPLVRSDGTSWVGRTIHGTYHLEAPLGQGAMGAVYRARHLPTGAPCALKLLHVSRFASTDAVARFEREATLVRRLRHPSLVEMLDFGRADHGVPYVVMELLVGETLEQRLARQGVVAWPEVLRIADGVGGALAMAHASGLVHRDVKPANIMLADGQHGSRPVLIDFGLAKRMDGAETSGGARVTSTGVAVGTPLYMSPEQARGEELDARSDLYGLAVVVYEMIAGVPPFFDRTLAQVYQRLLSESPPAASHFAPQSTPILDSVLSRALSTQRDQRFADVPSFLGALRGAMTAAG
jgi:hypothetical protein